MTIGCDCSGIETPVMALENLGVRIVHKFSCDSDPHVQTVAAANFAPEHYFKDITQRNNKEHDLRVDL